MTSMMLQHAVREAFERMAKLYGRDFTSRWEGQDPDAVNAQWVYELQSLNDPLTAIAWALRHLPERPPNAVSFRILCTQMPTPRQVPMPVGENAPVRNLTAAELARLKALRDQIAAGGFFAKPGTAWAQRLLDRHESGEHHATPAALRMANAALGRIAHEPVPFSDPSFDEPPPWPELEKP